MKRIVPDASIVAAAFFQEEHADAAQKILASGRTLIAPDLLYAEIANVIWKRRHLGEITDDEAIELLNDALALPIEIITCRDLVDAALPLALLTRRTVYDCLYLAAALNSNATFITADRRLVNALARTPISKHIAMLGEHR